MKVFDFNCHACGYQMRDAYFSQFPEQLACPQCGSQMTWLPALRAKSTPFSPDESTVVWENPANGQVRYPARSDAQMPKVYAQAGYQRRELRSLREVEKFEAEKGVRSEAAWFDRGSGRGFESELPE